MNIRSFTVFRKIQNKNVSPLGDSFTFANVWLISKDLFDIYPAMVAEWAKESVLIHVELHRRSQVQILLEVRFICSKISRAYISIANGI